MPAEGLLPVCGFVTRVCVSGGWGVGGGGHRVFKFWYQSGNYSHPPFCHGQPPDFQIYSPLSSRKPKYCPFILSLTDKFICIFDLSSLSVIERISMLSFDVKF